MSKRKTMAETLRKAIEKSGETVAAISRGAGIVQPVLHRFVKEERDLTLDTAEKLVRYFELELRPVPKPTPSAKSSGPSAAGKARPEAPLEAPLEPLRTEVSMPPGPDEDVAVEYIHRGARVRKEFTDSYEARRFFTAKDKAGMEPKVVKADAKLREADEAK